METIPMAERVRLYLSRHPMLVGVAFACLAGFSTYQAFQGGIGFAEYRATMGGHARAASEALGG